MNYLIKIDSNYCTKNRLEEAILRKFREYDRSIVRGSHLDECIKEISESVQALNKKFPRCKPFTCHWRQPRQDSNYQDYILTLAPSDVCNLRIYSATNGNYIPASHYEQPVKVELA